MGLPIYFVHFFPCYAAYYLLLALIGQRFSAKPLDTHLMIKTTKPPCQVKDRGGGVRHNLLPGFDMSFYSLQTELVWYLEYFLWLVVHVCLLLVTMRNRGAPTCGQTLSKLCRRVGGGGGGAVAQSVERATPGEEVPGSIPAVAARSLLVGSVSV